jgi:hypothetical protein
LLFKTNSKKIPSPWIHSCFVSTKSVTRGFLPYGDSLVFVIHQISSGIDHLVSACVPFTVTGYPKLQIDTRRAVLKLELPPVFCVFSLKINWFI